MNNENAVVVPEKVSGEIDRRVAWARALRVTSQVERDAAWGVLREVKALAESIKGSFESSVKAAHAAWKAAVAHRDSFLAGPAEVERLVKAAIVRYDTEAEAARMAEQRRLQAEADERARKERERLEAAAAKLKTPELKAERLEAAAAVIAPVITIPEAPRQDGESKAVIWKGRVTDHNRAVKALYQAGRLELLEVNGPALNALARACKGLMKIDGVEWYAETQLRVRK